MDAFWAALRGLQHSASSLDAFVLDALKPWTAGCTAYLGVACIVLCVFVLFGIVASARAEKLHCNGYAASVVLWLLLYNCLFTLLASLRLPASSLQPVFVLFHALKTGAFLNFLFASLLFMASNVMLMIDKPPYTGFLLYLLSATVPSFFAGMMYYGPTQIRWHFLLLYSGFSVVFTALCVATGVAFCAISFACSFRVSMKSYYKPALFCLVPLATCWHSIRTAYLWMRYSAISATMFEDDVVGDYHVRHLSVESRRVQFVLLAELLPQLTSITFCAACMLTYAQYRSPLKAARNLICGRYLKGRVSYPVQLVKEAALFTQESIEKPSIVS